MKTIEICCCSVDDAVQAYRGGADRIELNSAFEAGGLTPTLACLQLSKKKVPIPIICMIRPRTGGFNYTELEFETMQADARLMLENGADGIAVGILKTDSAGNNTVDEIRTKIMADICKQYNKECVFHRAIDVTSNLLDSADVLIRIGVNRILTSGGKQRCLEGIETINQLVELKSDKIEILACGSIRPTNIAEIISKTECNQFHMALMHELCDNTMVDSHINFNGTPNESHYKMIDAEQVREVSKICK